MINLTQMETNKLLQQQKKVSIDEKMIEFFVIINIYFESIWIFIHI